MGGKRRAHFLLVSQPTSGTPHDTRILCTAWPTAQNTPAWMPAHTCSTIRFSRATCCGAASTSSWRPKRPLGHRSRHRFRPPSLHQTLAIGPNHASSGPQVKPGSGAAVASASRRL